MYQFISGECIVGSQNDQWGPVVPFNSYPIAPPRTTKKGISRATTYFVLFLILETALEDWRKGVYLPNYNFYYTHKSEKTSFQISENLSKEQFYDTFVLSSLHLAKCGVQTRKEGLNT